MFGLGINTCSIFGMTPKKSSPKNLQTSQQKHWIQQVPTK